MNDNYPYRRLFLYFVLYFIFGTAYFLTLHWYFGLLTILSLVLFLLWFMEQLL